MRRVKLFLGMTAIHESAVGQLSQGSKRGSIGNGAAVATSEKLTIARNQLTFGERSIATADDYALARLLGDPATHRQLRRQGVADGASTPASSLQHDARRDRSGGAHVRLPAQERGMRLVVEYPTTSRGRTASLTHNPRLAPLDMKIQFAN